MDTDKQIRLLNLSIRLEAVLAKFRQFVDPAGLITDYDKITTQLRADIHALRVEGVELPPEETFPDGRCGDTLAFARTLLSVQSREHEAAIATEREAFRELLTKAREVAEWHVGDGDECGTLARIVMAEIDALAL